MRLYTWTLAVLLFATAVSVLAGCRSTGDNFAPRQPFLQNNPHDNSYDPLARTGSIYP